MAGVKFRTATSGLTTCLILMLCYALIAVVRTQKTVPDEQLLISSLLFNYDASARPVYNASQSVEVKFGMSFIQICDMDERNQILTTNVWLELASVLFKNIFKILTRVFFF
jgi:hypothetical protein